MTERPETASVEWPTLALFAACMAAWGGALLLWPLAPLPACALAAVAIAFHSSLQHEAIHGHPFADRRLNTALAWPPLTLAIPFLRFRDTHLAHHRDSMLTDPYDDPESNYLAAPSLARLPRPVRVLLRLNNTLAGRILIGPAVGFAVFVAGDVRAIRARRPGVLRGWLWHLPALAAVLGVVALSPMPLWAYALAAYAGLGLLKIRTFLEHRAHEQARARTVIIEDRGPLALLFLNNNLHVVHHMHPRVPWYRLPRLYARNPGRYLAINDGYRYASYGEVLRRHLFRAKDPVAHPLWHRG